MKYFLPLGHGRVSGFGVAARHHEVDQGFDVTPRGAVVDDRRADREAPSELVVRGAAMPDSCRSATISALSPVGVGAR